MNKIILWVIVVVVIVGAGWYFFSNQTGTSAPAETGPIKIGAIGPFSGDAAGVGQ